MKAPKQSDPVKRLLEIMRILRSGEGCPWDREQSLETLRPHLVEESYEVLDAMESGDREKLKEELGDLLLQIVFQSQICSEEGSFTFEDVAGRIADKLVHRHPHVFGDVQVSGSGEVLKNWERIKRDEKEEGPRSVTEGIPRHLPALHKAEEVQKRAARVGFDWCETEQVMAKLDEEVAELKEAMAGGDPARVRDELGDVLFTVVNLARFEKLHAEQVLNDAVTRFSERFRRIENHVHEQGRALTDYTLDELETLWQEGKR